MLYDVECVGVDREFIVKSWRLTPLLVTPSLNGEIALPDAIVGYALPWNATNAAATLESLRSGLRARFLSQPFTIAGRRFAKGAAIFRASDNGAELKSKLAACRRASRRRGESNSTARSFRKARRSANQAVALNKIAEGPDGVGCAGKQPVGGLDALRVGAPLRPTGHVGPGQFARIASTYGATTC